MTAPPTANNDSPTLPSALDFWVGTNLGVLKGVSIPQGGVVNYCSANRSLEEVDKSEEVCVMCWDPSHLDNANNDPLLYCGLRNGLVQEFNVGTGLFQAECDCTGGLDGGTLVGLGKHEDVLMTCTDRGDLEFSPPDTNKIRMYVGRDVAVMTPSPTSWLQVATGGRENPLKLWDGNRPEGPLFQAKNVRNDKLDLRVPEWVSTIGFVPDTGDQPTLAVATGYHQVRLYDVRAQRRPVYSQEHGEHPFYALTVTHDGRHLVVGNSIGEIRRIDVRTGKVVSRYNGCRGSVRDMVTFDSGGKPCLAVVCLDRYLRVYSLEKPSLLHKIYLKLQPTCLLYNVSAKVTGKDEAAMTIACEEEGVASRELGVASSEDEDEVWGGMETVKDRPTKRKTVTKKPELIVKKTKVQQT